MWLNENNYIDAGILDGLAFGYFRSEEEDFYDDVDDGYTDYSILILCFYVRLRRWRN